MKRWAAAVAAFLAFLPGMAAAQVYQNELSVFGTMDNVNEPIDHELAVLNLRYGFYFSPRTLATLGLAHARFDTSVVDTTSTSLTAGVKHYFGEQAPRALLPFVEAALGLARVDSGVDEDTDFTMELGAGAAWFITDASSVDVSLRWYHTDTNDGTEGLRLFLGLTTRF